jgi:predicted RNA-binding protein with PUA-like domain
VANNLARKHLRQIRRGDRIFFYHTGDQKAVVGEMRAISGPEADPTSSDENGVAVQVKATRALAKPVTLAQIKAERKLKTCDLVRISRLSVVPLTQVQWERIEELSRS